jgi:type II secretory pathway pseudopilin PulG
MKPTFTDKRGQFAFTLAEVLAAMLFMAIVIPVAVRGLRIASLAGEVAERKSQAIRVAESVLNENIVLTNWTRTLRGTVIEGVTEYRYTLHSERWNQDTSADAPSLVTIDVDFPVQDKSYTVHLSTLANMP